jgi:hypothetical protein
MCDVILWSHVGYCYRNPSMTMLLVGRPRWMGVPDGGEVGTTRSTNASRSNSYLNEIPESN